MLRALNKWASFGAYLTLPCKVISHALMRMTVDAVRRLPHRTHPHEEQALGGRGRARLRAIAGCQDRPDTRDGGHRPAPTSTSVPTMLRTMWRRKPSPSSRITSGDRAAAAVLPFDRPHGARGRSHGGAGRLEGGEIVRAR